MLKAKVLQCDAEKEKMVLSFKAAGAGDTEETPKPQFDCEVGKVRFKKNLTLSVYHVLTLQHFSSNIGSVYVM